MLWSTVASSQLVELGLWCPVPMLESSAGSSNAELAMK